MAYFAEAGIKTLGYDPDADRVNTLNSGIVPVPGLESWFDFDTTPLISGQMIVAT